MINPTVAVTVEEFLSLVKRCPQVTESGESSPLYLGIPVYFKPYLPTCLFYYYGGKEQVVNLRQFNSVGTRQGNHFTFLHPQSHEVLNLWLHPEFGAFNQTPPSGNPPDAPQEVAHPARPPLILRIRSWDLDIRIPATAIASLPQRLAHRYSPTGDSYNFFLEYEDAFYQRAYPLLTGRLYNAPFWKALDEVCEGRISHLNKYGVQLSLAKVQQLTKEIAENWEAIQQEFWDKWEKLAYCRLNPLAHNPSDQGRADYIHFHGVSLKNVLEHRTPRFYKYGLSIYYHLVEQKGLLDAERQEIQVILKAFPLLKRGGEKNILDLQTILSWVKPFKVTGVSELNASPDLSYLKLTQSQFLELLPQILENWPATEQELKYVWKYLSN